MMLFSMLEVMDVSGPGLTSQPVFSIYNNDNELTSPEINKAMFDLATDKTSLEFIRAFVSAKKPVSAVCHGPAALVNAIDATGQPLLKGATVTGFSNVEEGQLGKAALMPFELETELNKASGGRYVKAEQPWGEKVVVSKAAVTGALVITGQNPASATGVGREILKALV